MNGFYRQGEVIAVKGSRADVKLALQGFCSGEHKCATASFAKDLPPSRNMVKAENGIGACVGERVIVDVSVGNGDCVDGRLGFGVMVKVLVARSVAGRDVVTDRVGEFLGMLSSTEPGEPPGFFRQSSLLSRSRSAGNLSKLVPSPGASTGGKNKFQEEFP